MNERPPGLDRLLDYVTARLEEPTECGRCEHPFQHPPGQGYGVTRHRNTQWCTDCVDRCFESEIADHPMRGVPMMEQTPIERLTANPEPLKTVETHAGEKRPVEKEYIICTVYAGRVKYKPQRIRRISIHRKGCAHISPSYDRRAGSSDDVSQALAKADSHGAKCAISCRGCGGWAVS